MKIQKLIGSKLLARDLPNQSLMNIQVVAVKGESSLLFTPYGPPGCEREISLSDLSYIVEWASKP